MSKIGQSVKGFVVVSLGLTVAVTTAASALFWYRGANLYWQEVLEFKGAFSRTLGGDWDSRRVEWLDPAQNMAAYSKDAEQLIFETSKLDDEARQRLADAYQIEVDIADNMGKKDKKKKG